MADDSQQSNFDTSEKFKGSSKLPKHVLKDGAKWLMMPSKIILDGLCVWPERQNNATKIFHVVCVLSFASFIVGQFFYITDENADLRSISYTITLFIVSVETTARRILCYLYRKRLLAILGKIYFDFWPSRIAGEKTHKEVNRASWYIFLFCFVYTISAVLWAVQYIAVPFQQGNLPMRTKYPFEWKETKYYEFLYVYQCFFGMELALNVCGLDLFFMSILGNCVAQFKLLRIFLRTNFEKAIRDAEASGGDKTEARKILIVCIERHNKLIETCREVNNVFTYFILLQCFTSMGTVCVSSFVATVMPEQATTAFSYLFGHVNELLIYCYMGNELMLESSALADDAFRCGWHLSSDAQDLQKSLVMIMLRAQRPVHMSAGGFGFLSLSSFMNLLKFSFSVYTLLNSMLKKQSS